MGTYNLGVGIIRRGPTNEKPGNRREPRSRRPEAAAPELRLRRANDRSSISGRPAAIEAPWMDYRAS